MDDTICAISTALGVGGISIIRVSGENAIKIVNSVFKGKNLETVDSHTITYGHIIFEEKIIDEVLVTVMKAPRTYTTDDVVEINSHGGIATTNKVLEILLSSGCRQAEPGEFTKRAFLNGRIDLVEAEAVGDIINAESENARNLSVNQLTGKLSAIIKNLRERLLEVEANIEVNIDYPEYEDIEDMTTSKVGKVLEDLSVDIQKLIDESKNGKIIKNGIDVAIIGKPNVGKSSILNALLEEEKAIVTDIEGTTRDIVEGKMILSGITINFIDTAGIRNTNDVVEQIGVSKSIKQIDSADLIILVLNNNEQLTDEELELFNKIKSKNHIVYVNKCDLENNLDMSHFSNVVFGNTIDDDGLDNLKKAIIDIFALGEMANKDFTYISNARQLSLISEVKKSIDSAVYGVKNDIPVDIIEIDLSHARTLLGEIIGDVYDEELIDKLFENFCLGK